MKHRQSGSFTQVVFWGVAALIAVLVIVPLIALAYGALHSHSPSNPDSVWTLQHFAKVYLTNEFRQPLINSLYVAILVTIFATTAGTALAWLVGRTDVPFKSGLELLIIMPLFLSHFTTALAWTALGSPRAGMLNIFLMRVFGLTQPLFNVFSVGGIVFVLSIAFCPYAYLLTIGALRTMDPSLEEASNMLGGGLSATIRRVTMPMVAPAIASSALLIFVLSLETFTVPALLGVDARFFNLLYVIYSSITSYPPQYPLAAAAGTILLWFTMAGMYLYQRMLRQQSKFVTITARGYRPRLIRLGRWKSLALGVILLYGFITVVLPYSVLIIASFLPILSVTAEFSQLTLQNYQFIFTESATLIAIRNSLVLAVGSATICVLLAGMTSYIVYRTNMRGRRILEYIASIPLGVPGLVLAVGMLWAYIRVPLPIYGTTLLLFIAYVTRYTSYGLRATTSGLLQIDRTLEEAATVAGASRLRVLRDVTARLLGPSALGAWMLIFITAIREVDMALMLYTPKSPVMSALMWNYIYDAKFTKSYALGTVQTVMILIVVFLAGRVFRVQLSSV